MARQWTDPPSAVSNYVLFRSRAVAARSSVPPLPPGVTCRVLGHEWAPALGEAGAAVTIGPRQCVRCHLRDS